jgi:sortase B
MEAFGVNFVNFGWIFMVMAGVMALSLLFVLLSMGTCAASKKRATFAYLGFGCATVGPLVFFFALFMVNRMVGQNMLRPTLYPYLALLAGVLAMIYCVRFPVVSTTITDRRSGAGTRFITSFVPVKGDGIKEGLRKVVFTGAVICFFYFGAELGAGFIESWREDIAQKRRGSIIGAEVDINDRRFDNLRNRNPLPDYLALYAMNSDMVGYIRVGDTRIDYPVVQGEDNRFYLKHTFDREPNMYGAIFADRRNHFEKKNDRISGNTILYGHNSHMGTFFAPLTNYHPSGQRFNNMEFYRNNPVIIFDTLFEKMEWKVFGVVLFNTQEEYGEAYDYWNTFDFANADEFNTYVLDIMDRSAIFTDVDLQYGDNLLTLSTCFYPFGTNIETRLVVFARRVRAGESSHVDVSKARVNTGVKRFDLEARRMGNTWNGRVWDYETYLR